MYKNIVILLFSTFGLIFGQYDYSLEDLNTSSEYFGENVGTSTFENHVTLHYFGHFN